MMTRITVILVAVAALSRRRPARRRPQSDGAFKSLRQAVSVAACPSQCLGPGVPVTWRLSDSVPASRWPGAGEARGRAGTPGRACITASAPTRRPLRLPGLQCLGQCPGPA